MVIVYIQDGILKKTCHAEAKPIYRCISYFYVIYFILLGKLPPTSRLSTSCFM